MELAETWERSGPGRQMREGGIGADRHLANTGFLNPEEAMAFAGIEEVYPFANEFGI